MFRRLVLCVPILYQTTLTSEALNSSDDVNVCRYDKNGQWVAYGSLKNEETEKKPNSQRWLQMLMGVVAYRFFYLQRVTENLNDLFQFV